MKRIFPILFFIPALFISSCVPAPAPVAASPPPPSETVTPTYDLVSTLTATPTYMPGFTLAPTFTTTPAGPPLDELSRVDRYQRIYYDTLPLIWSDMFNARYPEAIQKWDQVLTALPDYGYAYYQRAESYQQLGRRSLDQDEALSAFERALENNQSALRFNPLIGDLYLQRYQIAWRMAWFEPLRDDRSALFERAGADLTEAIRLGTSDSSAVRRAAFLSLDLGRCQEALDRFGVLLEETPANELSAEINEGLARSYLCFGWLEPALVHIDIALGIQNSAQAQLAKAIILINLGQPQEALEILNAWIAVDPYFYGERYTLRALIYHDLGRYDEAAEDLTVGQTQVWGQGGLSAYVEGLLASLAGDSEKGREIIEYAEATLPYDYGPLLSRIRADLELPPDEITSPLLPLPAAAMLTATPDLPGRVTPAAPTDYPTSDPTSITEFTVTPTDLVLVTPTLTSEPSAIWTAAPTTALTTTEVVSATAMPARLSLFYSPPSFLARDLPASFSGTGSFTLGTQPGGLTLNFQMPEPLDFIKIRSISFNLSPLGEAGPLDLYLLFFRYERPDQVQTSPGIPLVWGENRITPPVRYIDSMGGFFVRLVNSGLEALAIDDLRVSMVVEMADGSVVDLVND